MASTESWSKVERWQWMTSALRVLSTNLWAKLKACGRDEKKLQLRSSSSSSIFSGSGNTRCGSIIWLRLPLTSCYSLRQPV